MPRARPFQEALAGAPLADDRNAPVSPAAGGASSCSAALRRTAFPSSASLAPRARWTATNPFRVVFGAAGRAGA